jgi:hypothetical protein
MTIRTIFILGMAILTLGSACSTPSAPFIKDVNDDDDRTTFLLNYDLQHFSEPSWTKDCSIALTRLDTGAIDSVPVSLKKKQLEIEVPPGKYRFGVLSCGHSEHWDLENFGEVSVTATERKANYLGRFGLEVSKDKGTNELKINRGDREQTRKALTSAAQQRSPKWRRRVMSAYTEKAIPEKYLQSEAAYKRGSLSHVNGPKATLALMNFDDCEKAEFKINPTPLGILSYQVTYENDQFKTLKIEENQNSFSDSYIQCVESNLKSFKPGFSGKINYNVNL